MNLTDLLGVELPIIQAPMAGVQDRALAIAVSSAGGLGSLPCATLSCDALRAELLAIQTQIDKPVNVNFFCHDPPERDAEREAKWRSVLQPYFAEYKLGANDIPIASSGLKPFNHEMADVLEEFKPKIVSFHFGLPSTDLLARVKSWKSTILASATTIREAQWLEKQGVDGIIAQGLEAGGHRGMFLSDDLANQLSTFALISQIIKEVRVPVIAAGGIADAKGVAAALSLGAVAAQVGTAYLLCPETKTKPIHRAALKSEAAKHTAITNIFTGRPARSIVNRIIREIGPVNENAPAFPLASAALSPLQKQAESRGVDDFSPLWCGQNFSGCQDIPAAELTRKLAVYVMADLKS